MYDDMSAIHTDYLRAFSEVQDLLTSAARKKYGSSLQLFVPESVNSDGDMVESLFIAIRVVRRRRNDFDAIRTKAKAQISRLKNENQLVEEREFLVATKRYFPPLATFKALSFIRTKWSTKSPNFLGTVFTDFEAVEKYLVSVEEAVFYSILENSPSIKISDAISVIKKMMDRRIIKWTDVSIRFASLKIKIASIH